MDPLRCSVVGTPLWGCVRERDPEKLASHLTRVPTEGTCGGYLRRVPTEGIYLEALRVYVPCTPPVVCYQWGIARVSVALSQHCMLSLHPVSYLATKGKDGIGVHPILQDGCIPCIPSI